MHRFIALTALASATLGASLASAQTSVQYPQPTFDRWNYPFNTTPGVRERMSTFYPGFTPGNFDDRDAQALVSFATAGDFVPGLGAQNYVVTSARVVATVSASDAFAYDPTTDSFRSSLLPTDPDFVPDADAGLPVELFATGFNAGLNAFSYGETFAWGAGGPLEEDVRFAYAADFDGAGQLRDVSNNVRDRFEVNPLAVGQAPLNAGDIVPLGTEFTFDLNLSDPNTLAYLAEGLNAGILSFTISSLHPAAQGGPVAFPEFWSKEATSGSPIRFEITAQVIPGPAGLGALALAGVAGLRRRR